MTGERKARHKVKIAYAAVAAAFFIACVLITRAMEPDRVTDVRIVCLGDSILAQARDDTSIPARLQEKLGVRVFSGAFGGTCMGRQDSGRSSAYSKDSFSMAALAQAIGCQDFGPQKAAFIKDNGTEYFRETVDALERIDFSTVDILLIGHGANDYSAGIPVYNENDPFDEYSFAGALRSTVECLRERYPQLRIILVTPTYSWFLAAGLTCEQRYSGSGFLEDYVEAERQIAREYGLELIDNYHGVYPHEEWEDWELYTTDGLHPNEAGRELLAERLARYLEEHAFSPGAVESGAVE